MNETERLLSLLNKENGVEYPQVGYTFLADIAGYGRKKVYRIVNTAGGVVCSNLNDPSPRKRCDKIRTALEEAKRMKLLPLMHDALTRLNDLYGVGDIVGIEMDRDWSGGQVTRVRTSCQPEKVKFRFDLSTRTIYFQRRQKRIT